jgi:hypothetical protein
LLFFLPFTFLHFVSVFFVMSSFFGLCPVIVLIFFCFYLMLFFRLNVCLHVFCFPFLCFVYIAFFMFSSWRSLIPCASYRLFRILFFVPSFSLPFPFMHISRTCRCNSCSNIHTDAVLMPVLGTRNFATV